MKTSAIKYATIILSLFSSIHGTESLFPFFELTPPIENGPLIVLVNPLPQEPAPAIQIGVVLEPHYRTIISSQVNAQILKINRRMGDHFSTGDLLMQLDKDILEGNYHKSNAALDKATMENRVKEELFKDEAISLFELKESQAALSFATSEYITAKKLLEYTTIKAPFHGSVVRIAMDEYEFAQQGKELLEIVNDQFLYARFLLPSIYLCCVQIGDRLKIMLKETGEFVEADVNRIAPVIDPASSTVKIEAKLNNIQRELRPGMTGFVQIVDRSGNK